MCEVVCPCILSPRYVCCCKLFFSFMLNFFQINCENMLFLCFWNHLHHLSKNISWFPSPWWNFQIPYVNVTGKVLYFWLQSVPHTLIVYCINPALRKYLYPSVTRMSKTISLIYVVSFGFLRFWVVLMLLPALFSRWFVIHADKSSHLCLFSIVSISICCSLYS